MKYPINADDFIQDLRMECGINENAEVAYRAWIPAINRAYQEGRDGVCCYPWIPSEDIAAFEAEHGPMDDFCKRVVTGFINLVNKAYAQGVEDAARS